MTLDSQPSLRQIGNYEIIDLIAEGGMGAVYKGRSRATGDLVAIKIVPTETAQNKILLRRFEQEFRAASQIDHINVVKAIDYCGTGTSPFLVMEYVDGESLGQRVERDGPIPERDAVQLIGQVCEGLHRAHKQGLIHRDVKPDNVLVTHADGVVKLTDLGLVKDVEGEMNLTRTGRGLGTPHFMAPEQFRDAKNVDIRCDVYSLGATLYAIITGVIPFSQTSPLECWMKKTKNDFPQPRAIIPSISERVNWAICRAMNADPMSRPASCREFMEDLLGTSWRGSGAVGFSSVDTDAGPPSGAGLDRWYMVYRDENGQQRTVKGTTESIRRNLIVGALGDPHSVVVSRSKTGQFAPIDSIPEFRDLVVESPSSPNLGRQPVSPSTSDETPIGFASSRRIPTLGNPPSRLPAHNNDITTYHAASHDTTPEAGVPKPFSAARAPQRDKQAPSSNFDWAPVALIVIALLVGVIGFLIFAK